MHAQSQVIALDDLGSVGIAPATIPVGALQVGLAFALAFMPAYCGANLDGEEEMVDEQDGNRSDYGRVDSGKQQMQSPQVHAQPV